MSPRDPLRSIKAELVAQIEPALAAEPQKFIGARIGLAQADVSRLLLRKLDRFSIDRILSIGIRLGYRPTVSLERPR